MPWRICARLPVCEFLFDTDSLLKGESLHEGEAPLFDGRLLPHPESVSPVPLKS